MSAHTPGPWGRDQYGNLIDASGERVMFRSVSILCAGDGVAEAEANTDLAAAAPDLLALLIESQDSIGGDWRERRDAAIAKATGRQP